MQYTRAGNDAPATGAAHSCGVPSPTTNPRRGSSNLIVRVVAQQLPVISRSNRRIIIPATPEASSRGVRALASANTRQAPGPGPTITTTSLPKSFSRRPHDSANNPRRCHDHRSSRRDSRDRILDPRALPSPTRACTHVERWTIATQSDSPEPTIHPRVDPIPHPNGQEHRHRNRKEQRNTTNTMLLAILVLEAGAWVRLTLQSLTVLACGERDLAVACDVVVFSQPGGLDALLGCGFGREAGNKGACAIRRRLVVIVAVLANVSSWNITNRERERKDSHTIQSPAECNCSSSLFDRGFQCEGH